MNKQVSRYFLLSGLLGVLFYFLHILIGGILWSGYNHLIQPISDLTASGAPNRSILLIFTTIYGLLCIFFAINVVRYSKEYFNKLTLIGAIIFYVCILFQYHTIFSQKILLVPKFQYLE